MSGHRTLWPREHGAYAQLAAPLGTALLLAPPRSAALWLAAAAALAFLAHEPLLVMLGHRGPRMREEHGRRAAWRLGLGAALAAGTGAVGLWLAPDSARMAAALVAVPAALVLALTWRRAVHSLAGELAAAVALSGVGAPVAAASGLALAPALALWAAWAAGFGCSVAAVHRLIGRRRRPAGARGDGALAAGFAAVVLVSLGLAVAAAPLAAAAAPLAAVAAALVIIAPPASRLRTVGVVLVVGAVTSGAVAVAVVTG